MKLAVLLVFGVASWMSGVFMAMASPVRTDRGLAFNAALVCLVLAVLFGLLAAGRF